MSHIEKLINSHVDTVNHSSIGLSDFISEMNPSERSGFGDFLTSSLSEKFPYFDQIQANGSTELLEASQGLQSVLSSISNGESSPEKIRRDLIYFPSMPVRLIPEIQKSIFNLSQQDAAVVDIFPYTSTLFSIDLRSCSEVESADIQEINSEHNIYKIFEPIDKNIHSCYFKNSRQLSKVLNLVGKIENFNESDGIKLELQTDQETTVETIKNYSQLIQFLKSNGLNVEMANTRVFVDFLSYSVKNQDTGDFHPIIIPSWFQYQTDTTLLDIPGEHGESELLIYQDSENGTVRLGASRFYLGVPNIDLPGHGAFWRPNLYKKPDWYRPTVDYQFKENEFPVFLRATSQVAIAIHGIQAKLRLPLNSYGFYVCSDSISLATFKFGMEHQVDVRSYMQAMPLVRSNQELFRSSNTDSFNFSHEITERMGVSSAHLDEVFKPDYTLDGSQVRGRILSAHREHIKRLYPYFAETAQKIMSLE